MNGTYAQWAAWLHEFAEGQNSDGWETLPSLSVEDLGAVAATRLSRRFAAAFNQRLLLWRDRFNRDLEYARNRDDVREALTAARRRLVPLRALASSPRVFDELRSSLEHELREALGRIQHDLEDVALRSGRDGELLLMLIREQPVDRAMAVFLPPDQARTEAETGVPGVRRVLL